jgi:Fe-S-cluster containining protein
MSANLTAAQRRALAEQDARWLNLPLSGPGDPSSVAAHVRHLAKLMGGTRRASAAAAAAHWGQLYDRSVPSGFALACREGCAHCCCQIVLVYAPEAFRLAAQVGDRAETAAAMRKAAETWGEAASRSASARTTCPLLSNNRCSIYDSRPLNCRAFVAIDVRECISTFVMMGKFAVRMPVPVTNLRTFCHMLMMAALRLAGKDIALYEMNAAVSRILETPDAETRWLAGEDILRGLAQDVPLTPEIEAEIERLAALAAPIAVRA